AQARIEGADQVLAAVAGGVRVGVHRRGELRPEHDAVTPATKQPAEHLFAPPVGVLVGGVDEITAGIEEAVEDHGALRLVAAPLAVSKRRRAEAEGGHGETAWTEHLKVHQPSKRTIVTP